ncbi:patatin-like phospholipase family protein [Candidatus Pacearchaeota archaeon]|nr:patatin-like phospholipase family protein [Candidatus Pacearchaeota archaeon]
MLFNPENTAEVFSGGACRGFYLAGYIKLKEELGISDENLGKKTFKYGVSVGSLFSAVMEEGIRYKEIDEYFEKNQHILKKIFPIDFFGLFHLHRGKNDEQGYKIDHKHLQIANSGVARANHLRKFLDDLIGNVTFKERPRLEFIAVDWEKKCPIYLNYKTCPDLKISEGCLVSAAIPAIYPALKIKHNGEWKYAVDGGIIENFPMKHALENKNVKNIMGITFTGIFPKEEHPKAWYQFLAPTMTLCSTYNERCFMEKVLGEDYIDFVSKKGIKKITYNKRKLNLAIFAPKIDSKYVFKSSYEGFHELSTQAYNDLKKTLIDLGELQKKRFFFS